MAYPRIVDLEHKLVLAKKDLQDAVELHLADEQSIRNLEKALAASEARVKELEQQSEPEHLKQPISESIGDLIAKVESLEDLRELEDFIEQEIEGRKFDLQEESEEEKEAMIEQSCGYCGYLNGHHSRSCPTLEIDELAKKLDAPEEQVRKCLNDGVGRRDTIARVLEQLAGANRRIAAGKALIDILNVNEFLAKYNQWCDDENWTGK